MSDKPEALLRRFDAWEPKTDRTAFQWRARLLQSMWREERGLEAGVYRGKRRGARLVMPEAKASLANYLTPAVRELVRSEVDDPARARGKLFGKPRIYNNLLSSQPLCFNLFGELALDLTLATAAFRDLSAGRVHVVTNIGFEVSPGRGDDRYTGDRSAFDVYVRFEGPSGGRGFVGIEVKYHENLNDPAAEHRPRYDEVAQLMGCFGDLTPLRQRPLQQVWRDHLLVGAHQHVDGFDDAFFAFLYPSGNAACAAAVRAYSNALISRSSFVPWTLEQVVDAVARHTEAPWVETLRDRYLGFEARGLV